MTIPSDQEDADFLVCLTCWLQLCHLHIQILTFLFKISNNIGEGKGKPLQYLS